MKYENISYGHNKNHKFDIIIPEVKSAHAIIYIHGGAYLVGNKSEYPSFLAEYSEKNIFASIDYRLINGEDNTNLDGILLDINKALREITIMAKSKNVIIKDFILTGHSAGGHIALLYSYKYPFTNDKISACISLAGPTDFTDDIAWSSMPMWGEDLQTRLSFLSMVGSRLTGKPIELTQSDYTNQKNYQSFKQSILEISPITYISNKGNIPPTLLVHAPGDDQVPYSNAVRLKAALDFASVPNKLITPSGNANSHMLGGEVYKEYSPFVFKNQSWVDEAKEWLENYLQ